jgi:hypothetical protein
LNSISNENYHLNLAEKKIESKQRRLEEFKNFMAQHYCDNQVYEEVDIADMKDP